jgi:hypothetical protein
MACKTAIVKTHLDRVMEVALGVADRNGRNLAVIGRPGMNTAPGVGLLHRPTLGVAQLNTLVQSDAIQRDSQG